MIVSHEHRFIFLKTRKTAGTSVEIALSTVCGNHDIVTPVSTADEELRRSLGGLAPQFHDSPLLRRRAYNHAPARVARSIVGPKVWNDYYKLTIERNPWDTVVSLYYWMSRKSGRVMPPFNEFVHLPRIEELATKNAAIYRLDGNIAVDDVLRQESLTHDLERVWSKLSLPGSPSLPRAKPSPRPSGGHYRDMFDSSAEQRIRKVFAKMIADFGYEF